MGLTLVEKIISEHARRPVHAGELVISKVDVSAVQDGTGPLTVQDSFYPSPFPSPARGEGMRLRCSIYIFKVEESVNVPTIILLKNYVLINIKKII